MENNLEEVKAPTILKSTRESVHVFAPATVANVVCGFDVLGFAVNEPGDEVIMRQTNKPGITISKITGDDGRLPLDPAKNTVSVSVQHYLQSIGPYRCWSGYRTPQKNADRQRLRIKFGKHGSWSVCHQNFIG